MKKMTDAINPNLPLGERYNVPDDLGKYIRTNARDTINLNKKQLTAALSAQN